MAGPARRARSPSRRSRRLSLTLVSCCSCLSLLLLLLLTQVKATEPPAEVAVTSPTGAMSSLALPAPGPLAALQGARKRGDYDDYEYADEGEDDDEDYDYYGTKQKKKKKKPAAAAQPIVINETNMFKFVSALVLRFVWGLASVFGFDEQLADAFGGAFVPPGVEVDDDGLGFDY